jgi:surface protein
MKKSIYIVLLAILPFWAQAQIGMSIQNTTAPPEPFVSTWNTNNINTVGDPTNQIILPLKTSGSYAFVVDWGDGSTSVVTNTNMSTTATHVYGVSGIYTLTITGRILGWKMLSSESKKITEISQWGTLKAGALGFLNCENLLINASDALDLEANLGQMFQGCSSLVSLDTSNWDTSSVTNLSAMFSGCSSLVSLDTSNWNTSLVTNLSAVFSSCSSLVSLDASNWDTSSVTNILFTFSGCSSLVNLNVSDWDVGSLQSAHYAFYNSPMISALNIASWKNKNSNSITNFTAMFRGCSSLTTLDVSGLVTTSATNMDQMFRGCSSLVSLDASNWDTSSVMKFSAVFATCSSLVNLDVSGWDVGSGTDFSSVFSTCSSLVNLDVSGWDVSSGTDFIDFAFIVTIPTAIYDQTLVNWEALNLQPGASQEMDFGNSKYTAGSAAETARANIIANDGWAISDGGSTP